MLETRTHTDLETWFDVKISDINRKMERRRLEGLKRRAKFREKMANLKERYEKLMERRFARMRKDGIDLTLAEFRRPDADALRKLRNIEEEEYNQLFGDGNVPSTSEDTTKIWDSDGEDENDNSDEKDDEVKSDESDFDSDRVEVDCELYGISNTQLKFHRARSNFSKILRPAVRDQGAESTGLSSLDKIRSLMIGRRTEQPANGPDISILRPTILEGPLVEEPNHVENTELDTIEENTEGTVKTIKLKQKQKKHHHHHHAKSKPKPIRANSQANFLKVKKVGDDSHTDSTETQTAGKTVALSEQKQKLRRVNSKVSAVNAIAADNWRDPSEQVSRHETTTKTRPSDSNATSNTSFSITVQARSVLKKRPSRAIIHNDSKSSLHQNESHN